MAPEFEAAARDLEPMVRLAKLDTEAAPEIAARYNIRSIPTMILFAGGREAKRQKRRARPSGDRGVRAQRRVSAHGEIGMASGKVALIAGGTRGIGLAVVAAMARTWAPDDIVYLTARKPADGERATSAARAAAGERCAKFDWLNLDLANPSGCADVARTLAARHGGVDVALMNGAYAPRAGVRRPRMRGQ